jgi:hypothetical protein
MVSTELLFLQYVQRVWGPPRVSSRYGNPSFCIVTCRGNFHFASEEKVPEVSIACTLQPKGQGEANDTVEMVI